MNPNQAAAYQALQQAQQALRAGDKSTARHFAEQAVRAAPGLEETWLMMAALGTPHASVEYLQRALQINPTSERAQKGMAWALERLKKEQAAHAGAPHGNAPPAMTKPKPQAARFRPQSKRSLREVQPRRCRYRNRKPRPPQNPNREKSRNSAGRFPSCRCSHSCYALSSAGSSG